MAPAAEVRILLMIPLPSEMPILPISQKPMKLPTIQMMIIITQQLTQVQQKHVTESTMTLTVLQMMVLHS